MKNKSNFKEVGTTRYGDLVVECPVCKIEVCEQGIRSHIRGMAQSEAWSRELGFSNKVKHLSFYLKNTINIKELRRRIWKKC